MDILRYYNLRQLSYDAAFRLLKEHCQLPDDAIQELLDFRPLQLQENGFVQNEAAKSRLREQIKLLPSSLPTPMPPPFKGKREGNLKGWLIIGCFLIFAWFIQALTNLA